MRLLQGAAKQARAVEDSGTAHRELARIWVDGFLLLGLVLTLPGPLLIAWQYHLGADSRFVGLHYLALSLGYVFAVAACGLLRVRLPPRTAALDSCILAAVSLAVLPFGSSLFPVGVRFAAIVALGAAAGLLVAALPSIAGTDLLFGSSRAFRRVLALWGCGGVLAAAAVCATYFTGMPELSMVVLAAVPLLFALGWFRSRYAPSTQDSPRTVAASKAQSMSSTAQPTRRKLGPLLLVSHFGGAYTIAAWLPISLVRRLGASPVDALFAEVLLFGAFTLGCLFIPGRIRFLRRQRGLSLAMLLSLTGYTLLILADATPLAFGAATLIGAGYAGFTSLAARTVIETPGSRIHSTSPALTAAIGVSLALPCAAGFIDWSFGPSFVIALPIFASLAAFVLAMVMRLQSPLAEAAGREKTGPGKARQ